MVGESVEVAIAAVVVVVLVVDNRVVEAIAVVLVSTKYRVRVRSTGQWKRREEREEKGEVSSNLTCWRGGRTGTGGAILSGRRHRHTKLDDTTHSSRTNIMPILSLCADPHDRTLSGQV